jgi:hypothetical protein
MNYKYKKNQIFGKRLKVPKDILQKVYSRSLTVEEYIKYELDDKIPISCIDAIYEREIVKSFGIEKCKTIDWEAVNKGNSSRDFLINLDPETEDINMALYEYFKDRMRPSNYPSKMKEIYADRLIEIKETDDEKTKRLKEKFNNGDLTPHEIVSNWNLFKDKDLSYCLNPYSNITKSGIQEFMSKYGDLLELIKKYGDLYDVLENFSLPGSEEEYAEYIKDFTDGLLPVPYSHLSEKYGKNSRSRNLSNEEYKLIFKYSSFEDYLVDGCNGYYVNEELKNLPEGYIFSTNLPFRFLSEPDVMDFIRFYGLKNVIDFDNENGNILTANNCRLIRQIINNTFSDNNTHEMILDFETKNNITRNSGLKYSKEQFYEIMKIFFIHRKNDNEMAAKIPSKGERFDYSRIEGVFREKYPELFISKDAPIELQKKFYSKTLTLEKFLSLSDEEKRFLEGKDFDAFVESVFLEVFNEDRGYNEKMSICSFVSQKTDFKGLCDFISEYYSLINNDSYLPYLYVGLEINDGIGEIKRKIHKALRQDILVNKNQYPKHIPSDFKKEFPQLFLKERDLAKLDEKEREALVNAFYSRSITVEFLESNPKYLECVQNLDPRAVFNIIKINYGSSDLIEALAKEFGNKAVFEIMMVYGKYLEKVLVDGSLGDFRFHKGASKDEIFDMFDAKILEGINMGRIKYDDTAPTHFRNNNPTLFLPQDVPEEVKTKFYNREFTVADLKENPGLLKWFYNTNIAAGLSTDYAWIIPLFSGIEDVMLANKKRLVVVMAYQYIPDAALQREFVSFMQNSSYDVTEDNIILVAKVLQRLATSNSLEMRAPNIRSALAEQILKSSNPMESLNKIEDMFIKNNIPTVGKIYSCFEILYPEFENIHFGSGTSPTLAKSSTLGKKVIVFSDLIKAAFGSNNKSVNEYIRNIEFGSKMFARIKEGKIQFDSLEPDAKEELILFRNHLATLYNNTLKSKKNNITFKNTDDILADILKLSKELSPNGTLDYNLGDRVIRMFCGAAGINTLEEAKEYIDTKIKIADARNREAAKKTMVLEKGDLIEGIGDYFCLESILQNGCVAGEFLGAKGKSDATHLTADFSMITSSEGTNEQKINASPTARTYGRVWIVLKNDGRFKITKTDEETIDTKWDKNKVETYYAYACGKDHYGIRTGIASSEINYIMVDNYHPRIGFEIAKNGFYIPVVNVNGEVLFTPEDYDKLRSKLSGLSYYGLPKYEISKNLIAPGIEETKKQIQADVEPTRVQNESIETAIKNALIEAGIPGVTFEFSPDLSKGISEVYSTGSTSRNTNVPNDCDFDYLVKVDKEIYFDEKKLAELKTKMKEKLHLGDGFGGKISGSQEIDGRKIEIEISFCPRTDKIDFSTDIALSSKLAAIREQYPDSYMDVLANIVFAKKFFKGIKTYKSLKSDSSQGGLGGIGIENWILQHGGSFVDAARDFVEIADKAKKSGNKTWFERFKELYQVYDLGKNHYSEKQDSTGGEIVYPHDDFVGDHNKMGNEGFERIVTALKDYLYKLDNPELQTEKIL